jgi:hypothetical protein
VKRRLSRRLSNIETTSEKCRDRVNTLKEKFDELSDEFVKLEDELTQCKEEFACAQEQLQAFHKLLDITSKEKLIGRNGRGGGRRWPPRMVQLICEFIINGTPPSAIPSNLASMFAMVGMTEIELPSVSFCRECRTACQVMTETLAAYRVGKAERWLQGFFDGSSRRQIDITNFSVGIEDKNGNIIPITVASCIFPKDGTAEMQVEAIMEAVSRVNSCFMIHFEYFLTFCDG